MVDFLPYFFAYKTECFSFQNNPKNLGLFRKGKTRITAKLHRIDLIICTHSKEGNIPSHSPINTVSKIVKSVTLKMGCKLFWTFKNSDTPFQDGLESL